MLLPANGPRIGAGALIGGLWASGMGANEIANLAHTANWEDAGRFAGSWQGLMSNAGLREQLTPLFKGRPIESWPRRFGAVATNLANGHRRILMTGDGALAIQASSAVPVMFAPVTVGGERLAGNAFQSMHILMNALGERQSRDADFAIRLDLHEQLMKCGENAVVLAGRDAMRRAWPQIARSLQLRAASR